MGRGTVSVFQSTLPYGQSGNEDGHEFFKFRNSFVMHSSKYIQCAQILSKPKKSKKICASLSKKIKKKFRNIDLILSPAIGGIVIGYEIGKILNIETIFAERVKKKFHLRRGFSITRNKRVLIVEDVITTGKSVLECSDIVKTNKANLVGYACIIDRSDENVVIKDKIVSQIKFNIETFSEDKLPEQLKKIRPIKPGSRNLSK